MSASVSSLAFFFCGQPAGVAVVPDLSNRAVFTFRAGRAPEGFLGARPACRLTRGLPGPMV